MRQLDELLLPVHQKNDNEETRCYDNTLVQVRTMTLTEIITVNYTTSTDISEGLAHSMVHGILGFHNIRA